VCGDCQCAFGSGASASHTSSTSPNNNLRLTQRTARTTQRSRPDEITKRNVSLKATTARKTRVGSTTCTRQQRTSRPKGADASRAMRRVCAATARLLLYTSVSTHDGPHVATDSVRYPTRRGLMHASRTSQAESAATPDPHSTSHSRRQGVGQHNAVYSARS